MTHANDVQTCETWYENTRAAHEHDGEMSDAWYERESLLPSFCHDCLHEPSDMMNLIQAIDPDKLSPAVLDMLLIDTVHAIGDGYDNLPPRLVRAFAKRIAERELVTAE